MKVLVIGGSYFLGRVFTMIGHDRFDLTLVNRGQYSMESLGVKEYHFDRHDEASWQLLPHESYDAIVDFCAYQKGDIETVVKSYQGSFQQYILISTVDVYQRQTGIFKDENHPLETRHFEGEVGDYISNKILLEEELKTLSQQHHFAYTILRPGNIYGPFNYAPRESEIIRYAVMNNQLVQLSDAKAKFQLVYVKDVAKAIALCIEKKAYDQVFNVVAFEILSYDDINHILKECQPNIDIVHQSINEAIEAGYPLPYPIMSYEQELYNGQLICQHLAFDYTSFQEGMKKTYQAFLPIFSSK